MDTLSAYQQLRKSNLGENTELLMKYGLQAPVIENTSVSFADHEPKRKRKPSHKRPYKRPQHNVEGGESRYSLRVRLKVKQEDFDDYESLKDSDEESDDDSDYEEKNEMDPKLLKYLSKPNRKIIKPPRPNTFGSIKGVPVGTWWETRLDCNYDGIHRPTVAGIHPGPDGAYSVALSGGYEDDVDLGDSFTYTGEGGRDLKGTAANPKNLRTAPQSKDQALVRGNLALSRNADIGNPVRVIRGYKLSSSFAPEKGYRYDGLYKVTKYWQEAGKSGFKVYKFQFVRCDPEPAPWHQDFGSFSPMETLDDAATSDEDSDCSESDDWNGWPTVPSLPSADRFKIVYSGETEQVHLIGDQWHGLSDKSDGEPSPQMKGNSETNKKKEELTCEQVSPLTKRKSSFRQSEDWPNLCFTIECEGCVSRVSWINGEWQEVHETTPVEYMDDTDDQLASSYDWQGWPDRGLTCS